MMDGLFPLVCFLGLGRAGMNEWRCGMEFSYVLFLLCFFASGDVRFAIDMEVRNGAVRERLVVESE